MKTRTPLSGVRARTFRIERPASPAAPARIMAVLAAWLIATALPAPCRGAEEGPAERASARATMTTFLEAMNDAAGGERARLTTAIECLDLSDLDPTVRDVRGRELAVGLKEIIDHTRLVVLEDISDDPAGAPWVFLRESTGEVVIGAVGGDWRFTRETVGSVAALLETALERERIAGVPEAPAFLAPSTWIRSRVPDSLREAAFLLEHWQWLGLLALILIGVVVDRLVTAIIASTARPVFGRLMPHADPDVLRQSLRPFGILAMGLVWWSGLLGLGLPDRALAILFFAVKLITAASGVWAVYRFVDIACVWFGERAAATETKFDDLLVPLVRKSLKTFVVAFGLVFVADNLDIDITSLVAGLGLGGLAFALAAQDTVKNLFGSLTILLDRPFQVGDWIAVGDIDGTVEEVGFRSTRVRTFYNSLITLPNSNLINTAVDNFGARSWRRWSTHLSITYDTPPEKIEAFCEGVRELIRRHPHTRKDYFHVYANKFSAASLDVMLYVFFGTPDWGKELEARHALFLDILRLAEELKVEFAFPTQTLHVMRPGEMPDHGDPLGVEAAMKMAREKAGRITGG